MNNTYYSSTRENKEEVESSLAIIKGLSEDGGLFVPNKIPNLACSLTELIEMDYKQVAYEVMKCYFTDFTEDELKSCINNAYNEKFDTEEIAPLKNEDATYFLELFHGPTIAFKDMALSILPYLMKTAAKKQNIKNEIVILTATSGDTGKAALEGFKDIEGTKIIVFYPKGGVSAIQKQQMVTQKGKNTHVIAIEGNFDDAQNGVKQIFGDEEFNKIINNNGCQLSSANSINIGRLIPQVVYYFYAYTRMVKNKDITIGEKINIAVPTGNFGNILAAYYARKMGLPINKLICCSNENKVLFDFFEKGIYDKNREFKLTNSPSMDILISSNLERLLYSIANENGETTSELMSQLKNTGKYELTDEMKNSLNDFYAGYASEQETEIAIKKLYDKSGYLIDTHTAVGYAVYNKYIKDTQDTAKTVIASTASPYKFTKSVMKSIDEKFESTDEFELLKEMNGLSKVDIPKAVKNILNDEIIHKTVCKIDEMKDEVYKILNLK